MSESSPCSSAERRLLDDLADAPDWFFTGLAFRSGDEFLEWLVSYLARNLDVATAFVGEVCGDDWSRIRSLAVSNGSEPSANFEYVLSGTPCEDVMRQSTCSHESGVADRYPDDQLLRDMGIESYVGTPLRDDIGRPLGILVLLDRKPMDRARSALASETLELFSSRAAAELKSRRALHDLGLLLHSSWMFEEGDPIPLLAKSLAHAMHVKVAFVSRYADDRQERLRTLALCIDGEIKPNIEYALEGTPCEFLKESTEAFYASGLAARFPEDEFLHDLGAESYYSVAFSSSTGELLGHLGIIHDRPLGEQLSEKPLFRFLAERIASELERRQHEDRRLTIERRLLESQKMESLGVLAGGIAHDFNNLLATIMGNAYLARGDVAGGSPAAQWLDEIERASHKAADLCRQLLAYAGKGRLQTRRVDLSETCSEMVNLLEVSISKKCELRCSFAERLPAVDVDVSQVHQVLLNLITNAAEAIGDRPGSITVSTGVQLCTEWDLEQTLLGDGITAGEYVYLEVADTGCGIAADSVEKIFEPFYTTKQHGHGLGLAAFLGIMRGHGGTARVVSELGKGTVIRALFPTRGAIDRATVVHPGLSSARESRGDLPRREP